MQTESHGHSPMVLHHSIHLRFCELLFLTQVLEHNQIRTGTHWSPASCQRYTSASS